MYRRTEPPFGRPHLRTERGGKCARLGALYKQGAGRHARQPHLALRERREMRDCGVDGGRRRCTYDATGNRGGLQLSQARVLLGREHPSEGEVVSHTRTRVVLGQCVLPVLLRRTGHQQKAARPQPYAHRSALRLGHELRVASELKPPLGAERD
eukprot:360387-Prymnesium_polylepis.1